MAKELRTLVLTVDSERADELIIALRKRDYISVVELTRDERKSRRDCPACKQKLTRERIYTVDEAMCRAMLSVVIMMKTAKSVILVNDRSPKDRQPPVEQTRCVEMRPVLIERAEILGLIAPFQDGSRHTHFITQRGLEFFLAKDELAPVVVLGGKVIATMDPIKLEEVKFKDRIRRDIFIKEIRRAIRELPSAVIEFVQRGQMSLI